MTQMHGQQGARGQIYLPCDESIVFIRLVLEHAAELLETCFQSLNLHR